MQDNILSHDQKKQVLLIGASGAVGMATRDAITQYLGADVLTWDRPATTPDQISSREERVRKYKQFVDMQNDTLDGQQAKWLLRDYKKVPAGMQGATLKDFHNGSDIQTAFTAAFDKGVDCIVIAAGAPRSSVDEKREALIKNNASFFGDYGRSFAQAVIEKMKRDPDFHMPVVINAGNPMDTMTEVLCRQASEVLMLAAATSGKSEFSTRLQKEARSLRAKIIGQGGILDGSRAAFAISDVAGGIPPENISAVPVTGTHNENMVVDLEHVTVKDQGKEVLLDHYLMNYCNIDLEAAGPEIVRLTRGGGKTVIADYKKKTGSGQSATLATGAAIMQMVDACINDRQKILPAAIFNMPDDAKRVRNITDGAVMGQLVRLGKAGVTEIMQPRPVLSGALHTAREKARTDVIWAHNPGSAL